MLKPKNAEVYLIYECPICNCDYGDSVSNIRRLKGFTCTGCNHFFSIQPIEIVKVSPRYKQVKTEEKPAKSLALTLTKIQRRAIIALIRRGFPREETISFVQSRKYQSVESYIQAAIRKGLE